MAQAPCLVPETDESVMATSPKDLTGEHQDSTCSFTEHGYARYSAGHWDTDKVLSLWVPILPCPVW